MGKIVFGTNFLRILRIFVFSLLFVLPGFVFCADSSLPIEINGDKIEMQTVDKKGTVKGHVRMKYEDTELFCDEAYYDGMSYNVYAKGRSKIVQKGTTAYAENIIYNFQEKTMHAVKAKMQFSPLFAEYSVVDKVEQKDEYVMKKGYVTTCDRDNPHYRFTTTKARLYPKKRIIAKNVIFWAGKVPLFYLPYYSQPLDKKFIVRIVAGRRKEWGNYALTSWRYHMDKNNDGSMQFDRYEKRGWGIGARHKTSTKNLGEALVSYYAVSDKMYKLSKQSSLFDIYPERTYINHKYLEDDRYKAQVSYSLSTDNDWTVIAGINKFSDEFFMKDFFYREYEKARDFYSSALIVKSFPQSSFSILTQKRVNRFYGDLEYLPQADYTVFTQKIGASNFYFDSNTKLASLTQSYPHSLDGTHASRFYNSDTISYPTNIKWLAVKPYASHTAVYYSRNAFDPGNSILRRVYGGGIDARTTLYRFFKSGFSLFGRRATNWRHILTPSVVYGYAHKPTEPNSDVLLFDNLDKMGGGNSATFTLDNKIQMKNGKERWDLLGFSPSLDYIFNQKDKGSYFSAANARLDIYPLSNVSVCVKEYFDIPLRRTSEASGGITIGGAKGNNFSVEQRYTRLTSTQTITTLDFYLTPRIRLHNFLRYEHNTKDFQEQEYAFRFDLHCWWLDLGMDVTRRNSETANHYRGYNFLILFTLKAFPESGGIGLNRAYYGTRDRFLSSEEELRREAGRELMSDE